VAFSVDDPDPEEPLPERRADDAPEHEEHGGQQHRHDEDEPDHVFTVDDVRGVFVVEARLALRDGDGTRAPAVDRTRSDARGEEEHEHDDGRIDHERQAPPPDDPGRVTRTSEMSSPRRDHAAEITR
jgi:hypothetical protein